MGLLLGPVADFNIPLLGAPTFYLHETGDQRSDTTYSFGSIVEVLY